MPQEYEYKVTAQHKNGNNWPEAPPTMDPKVAGERRQAERKDLKARGGGKVILSRRTVGEWTVIEYDEV